MSNENKEKSFPEGTAEEKELDTVPETDTSADGEWQWDAAVPETQTDDITVEDLNLTEAQEAVEETEQAEETEQSEQAEEEAEPANPDDDGLCVVCGNRRGNSPSDLYCNDCRRKFLRTNYGVGHVVLAFLMVFVAAIGYFVCATTCEITSHIMKAQSCIEDRRYDDAVSECSAISEKVTTVNTGINAVFTSINKNHTAKDIFTDGNRALRLVLAAYADTLTIGESQRTTFIQYVENIIGVDQLNKKSNANIKKVYDFCKEITDYASVISAKWQTFIYTDEKTSEVKIKYNEAMAYIDSLENDTPAKVSMNEYHRFMTAYYAKKSPEETAGYFEKAIEAAGEFAYMYHPSYLALLWEQESYDRLIEISEECVKRNINDTTAYYYAIKSNIIQGDFDAADARCEEMKKTNPDGLDYYSVKAEIFRRQGKLEECINICKEGIAIGTDAELYRQQAIAYMLLDDKEAALEASKQAYEITLQNAYSGTQVSLEVLNTAALIACIGEDNDTYEGIVAIFEQQNMTLEESVQNCIKGEITFEELFMEGTGDI
ncbi:MAG: tetratricopeptide repeat protein [Clostridia bacterium]|nr:tetratricopeptide repeat protein [Clostridia bacterium]